MIFWGRWRVIAQCVGILYWPWESVVLIEYSVGALICLRRGLDCFKNLGRQSFSSRASSLCVSFFLFCFDASRRRLNVIFESASSLSRLLLMYTVLSYIRKEHLCTTGVALVGICYIQPFVCYCFSVLSKHSNLSILWSVLFAATDKDLLLFVEFYSECAFLLEVVFWDLNKVCIVLTFICSSYIVSVVSVIGFHYYQICLFICSNSFPPSLISFWSSDGVALCVCPVLRTVINVLFCWHKVCIIVLF